MYYIATLHTNKKNYQHTRTRAYCEYTYIQTDKTHEHTDRNQLHVSVSLVALGWRSKYESDSQQPTVDKQRQQHSARLCENMKRE